MDGGFYFPEKTTAPFSIRSRVSLSAAPITAVIWAKVSVQRFQDRNTNAGGKGSFPRVASIR